MESRIVRCFLVAPFILAILVVLSGCGCTEYETCDLQDNGDYRCYPPTCPVDD